jgi:16S rRNA (uracil1498-N3)-methyltransferase
MSQRRENHSKAGGRVLVEKLPEKGQKTRLTRPESHHLISVLRMQAGDEIDALDGKGGSARCRILKQAQPEDGASADYFLEWVADMSRTQPATARGPQLILGMGILKGEAMEWVIEKSVELGADEVLPLVCDHSVVKLDRKGPGAFRERWSRIADQALKQCGRLVSLRVQEPIEVRHALKAAQADRLFFFDESVRQTVPHLANYLFELNRAGTLVGRERWLLLIGPEGGWSARERDDWLRAGAIRLSLGSDRVLRAETAALQSLAVVSSFRDAQMIGSS